MARIQKLPPDLWTNIPETSKDIYLFWIDGTERKVSKRPSINDALECIVRAEKKGIFAYAAAPIPSNDNQNGVFAFSRAGKGIDLFNSSRVYKLVRSAYNSLFETTKAQVVNKPIEVQTIKPVETAKMVAGVRYSPDGDIYHFYANMAHFPGDFVCVHSSDGDVNVEIVTFDIMKTSDVKKLVDSINVKIKAKYGRPIKDLSVIYKEVPTDKGWDKWTRKDVSEKYWEYLPNCDTDKDKEYSSSEEYYEDIAELQAMQACFMPAVDRVYPGDLPNPEPDKVWCNDDQINEAEEALEPEVFDLPE